MSSSVPVSAVPNQTLSISLANQSCVINLWTKTTGMFMDLYVNGSPIILGVICENLNRIVRDLYLGFSGDFYFKDTKGTDDPVYTGLGDRFVLIYLTADELPEDEG